MKRRTFLQTLLAVPLIGKVAKEIQPKPKVPKPKKMKNPDVYLNGMLQQGGWDYRWEYGPQRVVWLNGVTLRPDDVVLIQASNPRFEQFITKGT